MKKLILSLIVMAGLSSNVAQAASYVIDFNPQTYEFSPVCLDYAGWVTEFTDVYSYTWTGGIQGACNNFLAGNVGACFGSYNAYSSNDCDATAPLFRPF